MIKYLIEKYIEIVWLLGKRKRTKIYDEAIRNIRIINANNNGFSIIKLNPDSKIEFEWNQVRNLILMNDCIQVILNNHQNIRIEKYSTGYFSFLRNIPKVYEDFNYKSIGLLMGKLSDCEICGLISVIEGDCKSCGEKPWGFIDQKEYSSKEAYLKEMQAEVFEDEEMTNVSEFGFESSYKWKIY